VTTINIASDTQVAVAHFRNAISVSPYDLFRGGSFTNAHSIMTIKMQPTT
jgi:hypothetical protein